MMYALFLILNDIYKLDDILEVFYDIGVGATTLDSVGMAKILLQHNVDAPLFSSVRRLIEGDKPYSKTIITVIRDEEKKNKVIERINDVIKPGISFMFVMPVLECYGLKLEELETE